MCWDTTYKNSSVRMQRLQLISLKWVYIAAECIWKKQLMRACMEHLAAIHSVWRAQTMLNQWFCVLSNVKRAVHSQHAFEIMLTVLSVNLVISMRLWFMILAAVLVLWSFCLQLFGRKLEKLKSFIHIQSSRVKFKLFSDVNLLMDDWSISLVKISCV